VANFVIRIPQQNPSTPANYPRFVLEVKPSSGTFDQLQASDHKKKIENLDIVSFFLNDRKFINPLS
jgi:hypothetical protein